MSYFKIQSQAMKAAKYFLLISTKQLLFVIIFTLLNLTSNAQLQIPIYTAAAKFHQHTLGEPNIDSAVYYARILSTDQQVFRQMFHESFFNNFNKISDSEKQHGYIKKILEKLTADSSQFLSDAASPIYSLTQVQDAKNDTSKLSILVTGFIKNLVKPENVYQHKTGRYGLMIYAIISTHPELENTAQSLLNAIYNQLNPKSIPLSWTQEPEKKAWYKYMRAHVSYLIANQTTDKTKKEALLREAFDYSPDFSDINYESSYLYEKACFSGKESYRQEYLNLVLKNSADNNLILNTLLVSAIYNPEYKTELKEFYTSKSSSKTEFHEFWLKSVDSIALSSPPFTLKLLDGKLFNSDEQRKKWIVLDFWGTWCGPCREEHPDLQNFYDSVVLKNDDTVSLLTIACHDQEIVVANYMKEKNFSFPVAMSDNQIVKAYKIYRYPTKILITPGGKYFTIPIETDFAKFIKEYCGIDG